MLHFTLFPILSETSSVSLDSDISEFMPELQSLEAQAALDVPLMSQDPLEVEEMKEISASAKEGSTTTRRRKGGKGSGDDDSVISPVSAQGMYEWDYSVREVFLDRIIVHYRSLRS